MLSLALGLLGGKSGLLKIGIGAAAGFAAGVWIMSQFSALAEAERRQAAHDAQVLRLVAVNAATEAAHAQEIANLEANLAALNRVAQKEAELREQLEGVVEALASIDPADDCTGGPGFDRVIDMLWGEPVP